MPQPSFTSPMRKLHYLTLWVLLALTMVTLMPASLSALVAEGGEYTCGTSQPTGSTLVVNSAAANLQQNTPGAPQQWRYCAKRVTPGFSGTSYARTWTPKVGRSASGQTVVGQGVDIYTLTNGPTPSNAFFVLDGYRWWAGECAASAIDDGATYIDVVDWNEIAAVKQHPNPPGCNEAIRLLVNHKNISDKADHLWGNYENDKLFAENGVLDRSQVDLNDGPLDTDRTPMSLVGSRYYGYPGDLRSLVIDDGGTIRERSFEGSVHVRLRAPPAPPHVYQTRTYTKSESPTTST